MKKRIAILPGDGIGPEVCESATKVLNEIGRLYNHEFEFVYGDLGGVAIDKTGNPLPEETLTICRQSDAVLLGAVGGPKWDTLPGSQRPEQGLLGLRKQLELFANLRPVTIYDALAEASPLKSEVVEGVDLLIVRELTGGIYFGEPRERRGEGKQETAVDTLVYSREEIERIVRKGFEFAKERRGHLTSVDKANVLESSRLWREIVEEVAKDYPEVTYTHMLVDNAAMQLIRNPRQFDVMVTENMFGDILSDEASMITGSLGMLPSASMSQNGPGLFEPIHGSAPDIAGKGIANPLATLSSLTMMLTFAFQMPEEATALQNAINDVLAKGHRTADITNDQTTAISTNEMTEKVIEALVANQVPAS
ncbi:3-isopropylmalate dehydrogenase [Halalkalibacter akibai]|uniref:3-isopropylmalate dehydrogenase n=1 Tax=Halalkalibacter akibai (strain ATCC 43226 / DSM 21942 / CIP 109018 / JCM 9157 / 1139) TaxID=1236973 RepID=W4QTJ6_HALA3|nr:3-isopropylmalate dehydrogenase [Halalkalibacter akibai]GAE34913.1 3-isopropylmalate dehydrogenase [Halalkalibacter akibai JCM 9157]